MSVEIDSKDLTFRTTVGTKKWAISSDSEHVLQTVQRLLYTTPGSDIYDPKRGLDAMGRTMHMYNDGDRDTEYEEQISSQLRAYSDILPVTVVAIYEKDVLMIYLTVNYNSVEYKLQLSSDPNTLTSQITRIAPKI